jgi:hypothetical protein
LFCPTAIVTAEGFETPVTGKLIESGFGENQYRATGGLL